MVTIVTLPNDQKFDCADLRFMGGSYIEVIFAPKKKAKKVVKMLRSFVYTFISKSSFFRTNYPAIQYTKGAAVYHPFLVLKICMVPP